MGLFAVMLALHRPARHEHGAIFVEEFRQFADFFGTDAADFRRPFRGFGDAVFFALDIVGNDVGADAVFFQEGFVMPIIGYQVMADAQH